jgi:RpiR family carbohydrate utilization transcriptional regulator
MCEAPGSVVTLLCSGIQLYSAERRIADCILADVKRASMCTSAELARLSCSSEATITRLCHKLGFENYRKFQLALARDAMEQQEAQRMRDEGQDELHQALLNILANREEELRATIQAIDTRQLRQILSLLRSCEVIEVVSEGRSLPVALDASIRFGHLGKRCVASALHEKTLAFAQTLTPKDLLMAFSTSGRDAGLEEVISAAKMRGAPVLLITCDSHSPLAHLSDYVMTASNREQRLIEGSHAASLLSPNILVEVLYYLLRMEKART